ncbi:hypothetical protein HKX48_006131 [Thoreauomyces humboldtii]|nr:hypothetical protein HKX48_006131 [Thoreauomyces humboldtii]
MSFSWDKVDARQRSKDQQERELKQYLKDQVEETKERKLQAKKDEQGEYQRLYGVEPASPSRQTSDRIPRGPQQNDGQYRPVASAADRLSSPPLQYHPSTSTALSRSISSPRSISMGAPISSSFHKSDPPNDTSRRRLEQEVASGKLALASLAAQVDALTARLSTSHDAIHSAQQVAQAADRRARDLQQAMDANHAFTTGSMRNLVADVRDRHAAVEKVAREEGANAVANVLDVVAKLRYEVDGLRSRTRESGDRMRVRTEDLRQDSMVGVDAMRIAKAHDVALAELRGVVDAGVAGVERRMEAAVVDLGRRLDGEVRAREVCVDQQRGMMARHDREVSEAMDALRASVQKEAEQDRQDAAETMRAMAEQIRTVETRIMAALDATEARVTRTQDLLADERAARISLHDLLSADSADEISAVQGTMRAELAALRTHTETTREHLVTAIKTHAEAQRRSEAGTVARTQALERVLRAEIGQRVEALGGLQRNLEAAQVQMGHLEKLAKARDSKSVTDDLEVQIKGLRTRIGEISVSLASNAEKIPETVVTGLRGELADHARVTADTHTRLCTAVDDKIVALADAMTALTVDLNAQMKTSSLSVDQTLTAFKLDLATRMTRADLAAALPHQSPPDIPAIVAAQVNSLIKDFVTLSEFSRVTRALSLDLRSHTHAPEETTRTTLVGLQTRQLELLSHVSDLEHTCRQTAQRVSLAEEMAATARSSGEFERVRMREGTADRMEGLHSRVEEVWRAVEGIRRGVGGEPILDSRTTRLAARVEEVAARCDDRARESEKRRAQTSVLERHTSAAPIAAAAVQEHIPAVEVKKEGMLDRILHHDAKSSHTGVLLPGSDIVAPSDLGVATDAGAKTHTTTVGALTTNHAAIRADAPAEHLVKAEPVEAKPVAITHEPRTDVTDPKSRPHSRKSSGKRKHAESKVDTLHPTLATRKLSGETKHAASNGDNHHPTSVPSSTNPVAGLAPTERSDHASLNGLLSGQLHSTSSAHPSSSTDPKTEATASALEVHKAEGHASSPPPTSTTTRLAPSTFFKPPHLPDPSSSSLPIVHPTSPRQTTHSEPPRSPPLQSHPAAPLAPSTFFKPPHLTSPATITNAVVASAPHISAAGKTGERQMSRSDIEKLADALEGAMPTRGEGLGRSTRDLGPAS